MFKTWRLRLVKVALLSVVGAAGAIGVMGYRHTLAAAETPQPCDAASQGGYCCNCSQAAGSPVACQRYYGDAKWSCTSEFCSSTNCYLN